MRTVLTESCPINPSPEHNELRLSIKRRLEILPPSLPLNMTGPRSPHNKNKIEEPRDNTPSVPQNKEQTKDFDTHTPSNITEHPKHSTPYNTSSSVVRESP
jgi:hypothetical protein